MNALEKRRDVEILMNLLQEEGFKAVPHPHPHCDIWVKNPRGSVVIARKEEQWIVDYNGRLNSSFQFPRNLYTKVDVINAILKSFNSDTYCFYKYK